MALLACLWELAPRLGLELEVATVDHGLRPQAAAEADLVAQRAADLGLTFHLIRVDVAAARQPRSRADKEVRAPRDRGGVQEVARRLRLGALSDLAAQRGLDRIALGHQADDQTETVLFRVLRGTGLKGLAGIPYERGPFIRPLLDVTRDQILRYLHRRSLPYVVDPSNADQRYARSRLRHRILPLLRQENPRVDSALRSLAGAAAERLTPAPGLSEVLGSGVHVPTRVIAAIESAAREGHGTRSYHLGGGRQVTVSYGRVSLTDVIADPEHRRAGVAVATRVRELSMARRHITIPGPGTHPFAGGREIVVREEEAPIPPVGAGQQGDGDDGGAKRVQWAWFDGAGLSWPLVARVRRPGDRMLPRGGTGSRKLSDLLIDAKVPRRERAGLPVVTTADGQLLFVPGVRPARTGTPSVATKRWIGLAVVRNTDHDALHECFG
jgi:tRNA(Ile)-lysidine synthase